MYGSTFLRNWTECSFCKLVFSGRKITQIGLPTDALAQITRYIPRFKNRHNFRCVSTTNSTISDKVQNGNINTIPDF